MDARLRQSCLTISQLSIRACRYHHCLRVLCRCHSQPTDLRLHLRPRQLRCVRYDQGSRSHRRRCHPRHRHPRPPLRHGPLLKIHPDSPSALHCRLPLHLCPPAAYSPCRDGRHSSRKRKPETQKGACAAISSGRAFSGIIALTSTSGRSDRNMIRGPRHDRNNSGDAASPASPRAGHERATTATRASPRAASPPHLNDGHSIWNGAVTVRRENLCAF
jgi:hypothetical protein